MPRDLTDLMERATSFPPPEPHAAGDITRLAARRQQRRTTALLAGAAAVVVVAAGLAYGVTRHDSTPEPAAPYKYDQQVDMSDAVSASSLPGYQLEPWTVKSAQHFGPRTNPWATYQGIDADGRLMVQNLYGLAHRHLRVHLFDAPGEPERAVKTPAAPGTNSGHAITWVPSFLGEGELLWTPSLNILNDSKAGFHLTDLSGNHDVFVHSGFHVGKEGFDGTPGPGHHAYVAGDRMWFLSYDHTRRDLLQGVVFDLYTATFDGHLTKVAENVGDLAVGDGQVAWVTTSGGLMTQSADGGSPRSVDIHLDPGCRLPIPPMQSLGQMFAVSGRAISLPEECGSQQAPTYTQLAFDLSGRRLATITPGIVVNVSIVGDVLVFQAAHGAFRYDVVSGRLAELGGPIKRGQPGEGPVAAGDYVLWYDEGGGHVARIPS